MFMSHAQWPKNYTIYAVVRKGTPVLEAICFAEWSDDLSAAINRYIRYHDRFNGYFDSELTVFRSCNGETMRL